MIGSTHRRQIDAVFGDALALEGPARARLLDRACRDDRALRAAVESLLDADRRAGAFLARPLGRVSTAPRQSDGTVGRPGERIGPYRLIRQLGQGGMATVHLARRRGEHDRRPAALKLSHARLETEDPRSRLNAERRVLARLEHRNIVRLRDAGTTRDGRPFLVMDWIDGHTIDAYCRHHRVPPRQRMRLVLRVCAAVQAAHARGVVHCDLKPANILVSAEGVPVVIDFGIATMLDTKRWQRRALDPPDGYRVLTPGYASPEQRNGEPITVATDVYLLGLLLFELLTGRAPKPNADVAPRSCPRALSRSLPCSLGTIIRQALEPDPRARHRSVAHLSAALRNILTRGLGYTHQHEPNPSPGATTRPSGDSVHP